MESIGRIGAELAAAICNRGARIPAAEELLPSAGARTLLGSMIDCSGGPDRGKGKEYGDDGKDEGPEFGDVGVVLEDGKDHWDASVSATPCVR